MDESENRVVHNAICHVPNVDEPLVMECDCLIGHDHLGSYSLSADLAHSLTSFIRRTAAARRRRG
ncbi:hypothetical protein [Agreia sp. VKM Ac-1783]|jgi:hypothetical protein|uniref:hypothetical protein n=1 Tax=Agreia sp. VKM Ac-1783 TaxID=1938889 RepID=UPI000A2ABB71|nr:hypothetical protein [Agreia sp. VKM Ac-1783]SMQ67410.1 hypothetical protein SAMN06295943_1087 [Agreia sp. VKM Ac-1783]